MKRKTKIKLFIFSSVLFLIITPATILYSWGYRFDFENKRFVQTGAIYIKARPKNVAIYLDGKLIKKTDPFFGAIYIDDLLPHKYKIQVQKDGYYEWIKQLEVEERQVTEIKHILLIPKDLTFDSLGNNIETFLISEDRKKLILKENEEGKEPSLKLLNLQSNIKTLLQEKLSNGTNTTSISDELFNQLINTNVSSTTLISQVENNNIYRFDPKEKILYLPNESGVLEKIADGIKGVDLAPSLKKIAYFSNSEIWVLFLSKESGQQGYQKNEKVLIGRFSESINEVFWLTNDYLIFTAGNKIKIAETDTRDKINIVDVAQFQQPKIFFSREFNSLYVLSEKNLFVAKNILP